MDYRSFIAALLLIFSIPAYNQTKQVDIGSAVLHYTEAGSGAPVVFIHGALGDFRSWETHMDAFSKNHRAISYSRRLNYPNKNPVQGVFNAGSEADDLAAFVRKLDLDRVHLVGHSFGGTIALAFAKKYPELTRSIVVSEPPLINWLAETEAGKEEYEKHINYLWRPVQIAFDLRDTADVLRHTLTYFYGNDISPQLPPEIKLRVIQNFPEWKTIANSPDIMRDITREDIRHLQVPAMLITGGRTMKVLDLTNKELITLIPRVRHYHIEDGTHDFWHTHGDLLRREVIAFLDVQ